MERKRGPQRIDQLALGFMVNKRQSQDWNSFADTKSHALSRRKREKKDKIIQFQIHTY